MKFLWLSWKDGRHPRAGGAERVLMNICKRLTADGHGVTILTAGYPGAAKREVVEGIDYIRVGDNRYTHSFRALAHYLKHLRSKYDVVVEVVNTAPYFTPLFGGTAKRILLYHQLAREIWFHEAVPGMSHIGYFLLEPLATMALAASRVPTIAMSDSTRRDLQRFGFRKKNVHIIRQPNELLHSKAVVNSLQQAPTILSLGAIRSMKRTLDQVKAFEYAKEQLPTLRFKVAGRAEGAYGKKVVAAIKNSPYAADIDYLGPVSLREKHRLMRECDAIIVTSVKEGWGLIVSEAASQGTPAIVYDVDGLRDSVKHNHTGLVVAQNPQAIADGIVDLLADAEHHQKMRQAALYHSRDCTPENSYNDFMKVVHAV